MNIKLAYDFDLESYKSLFPEITLFNWEKDEGTVIDLMVFPGGEDVSLEYYLTREDSETYRKLCHTNRQRDDYEVDILDACYDRRITVKKILGICRGMQLINVMFGGKLFPDLHSINIQHSNIHELTHRMKSKFDFMKITNSLHHQGLSRLGQHDRRGNNIQPRMIADWNGIPEIVLWSNNRVLGVQFHPEYYYDENPDKAKFRDIIYSWIDDRESILL